jgi:hypothetical protein
MSHKQGRMNKQVPAITVVPFRSVAGMGGASTTAATPLQPSTFSRVGAIADAYDLFRVTKLRFRILPNAAVASLGWYPGINDTAPANTANFGENVYATIISASATAPSPWVDVPPAALRGMFAWYKSVPGTLDPSEETQGNIYNLSTAAAGTHLYEVEGIFEFKGPVNTGATPMLRASLSRQAEKKRILSLLSEPDVTPGSPTAKSGGPRA